MMGKNMLPYELGDAVEVHDDDQEFLATVRIDALNNRGVVIGTFFFEKVKDGGEIWTPSSPGYSMQFGDLDILRGKWPVVLRKSSVKQSDGDTFEFASKGVLGDCWASVYDRNVSIISRHKVSEVYAGALPIDRLSGASAVINHLKKFRTS
jgi:hypothetical protein